MENLKTTGKFRVRILRIALSAGQQASASEAHHVHPIDSFDSPGIALCLLDTDAWLASISTRPSHESPRTARPSPSSAVAPPPLGTQTFSRAPVAKVCEGGNLPLASFARPLRPSLQPRTDTSLASQGRPLDRYLLDTYRRNEGQARLPPPPLFLFAALFPRRMPPILYYCSQRDPTVSAGIGR